MKSSNNLFLLVGLSLGAVFCGCSTPEPLPFRQMPSYVEPETPYDTSATCVVYNGSENMRHIPDVLRSELSALGYTVYTEADFDKHNPTLPDFIIEPINWRTFAEDHLDPVYAYYAQLHVAVRRPGCIDPETDTLLLCEEPRDFIAVAQSTIHTDDLNNVEKLNDILTQATKNLMLNPRFREALQAPRPEQMIIRSRPKKVLDIPQATGFTPTDEQPLVGTWKSEYTVSSVVSLTLKESQMDFETVYTFREDGTSCSTTAQKGETATAIEFNYKLDGETLHLIMPNDESQSPIHRVQWIDNDTFILLIDDIEEYARLLKTPQVQDVTCTIDENNVVTAVMTFSGATTFTFTLTTPPQVYKRVKTP